MGPRALTASSGLAPWSMGCGSYLGSVEKNRTALEGQGGLVPLGCIPLWGERGYPRNFYASSKNARGFPMKIELFSYDTRFFLNTPQFTMIAAAPVGSPPRRISKHTIQKKPCPPCLGEAPRCGSIVYISFHGSGANTLSMPVSTGQTNQTAFF
jgi:hypothetical protein